MIQEQPASAKSGALSHWFRRALMAAAVLPILLLTAWGVDEATRPAPATGVAESSREPWKFLYFHLSTPANAPQEFVMEGVAVEFPNW